MNILDLIIFIVYITAMLGIGFYFHKKNKDVDDYYVGGRGMKSWHIGLSVVATDVGGGFSIGLGGLGFVIGLSGSWMLFTGLVGAWLSAVLLIPKVRQMGELKNLYTFPQIFEHLFSKNVALLAGIISAIGYIGFTSSQLLAGAKLASATFIELDMNLALLDNGSHCYCLYRSGRIKSRHLYRYCSVDYFDGRTHFYWHPTFIQRNRWNNSNS
jgi:SSS family solute:Na+ symporter